MEQTDSQVKKLRINRFDSYKDSPLFAAGTKIVRILAENGFKAFFVGGSVRDMLMGRPVSDIDIASPARPEDVQKLFPRSHMAGASFGVAIVVEDDIPFELATFREERNYMDGRHPEEISYTDDPALDALRRDFTINSMFFDPISGEVYDFTGGLEDISAGILRTVGDPCDRFSEDYLRMLRAVRFCTRFDYEMDPQTADAIRELGKNVLLLANERIKAELDKMLTGPNPALSIKMLHDLGLLRLLLPEVAAMDGITQPEVFHPEGDVLQHTLLMLEHMTMPSSDLAWSVLLHDVGKPPTVSVGFDNVEHFYGHEDTGARMAADILKRLRFPAKSAENIVSAVRNHMRFAQIHLMRTAKRKRIMAEENFPLELELHRIDCISCHGMLDNYVLLLDCIRELEGSPELPPPLLNGNDLIAIGMESGPLIGKILHKISDLQLEGSIGSKEEALDFARKLLAKI